MSVAILTDTNSGIVEAEARSLGIYVVPMPVIIDGDEFFEGINLTEEEFYQALESGKQLSTSQPSPASLIDIWDKLLKEYDELVFIPMSSGLSSTCSTAKALAQDYNGRVHVADNHRISVTMRPSAIEAKAMADDGKTGAEIAKALEDKSYEQSIYLSVDTLEYLRKGGRISAAAEKMGTLLKIKPVLTIQGEKIEPFSKVRGQMKKCQVKMVDALAADIEERFKQIPGSELIIGGTGSGLTEEEKEEWMSMIRDRFPEAKTFFDPLSASVGTHTGPKAYGIGVCY